MTQLQIDSDTLYDRIEKAIDIDTTLETPEGDIELSEAQANQIKIHNMADAIAEYISEVAMKSSLIKSTTFAPGSGDTGRQSRVKLTPHEDVEKEEMVLLGEELDIILSETEIFPVEYIISVAHRMGVDEEGYPKDRDEFYLCFAYSVRTHGGPQKPATEHTIISES